MYLKLSKCRVKVFWIREQSEEFFVCVEPVLVFVVHREKSPTISEDVVRCDCNATVSYANRNKIAG